jgi:colanic acid/amylovoran biosynthesis glycosyltransferase
MRLAVVVNRFPSVSETFIFNKVMGLRDAGIDVTVLAHGYTSDLSLFTLPAPDQSLSFVRYSLTARGSDRLGLDLSLMGLTNPGRVLSLWKHAQHLYGKSTRALKAGIRAVPLFVGEYDLIHFAYSGLAVSYSDALPLLGGAKLITSCRGAAEQITPLVKPERAERLTEVFSRMDLVHCVSADMLRTAEQYGLSEEKAFINHPAIDLQLFKRRLPYAAREQGPYSLLSTGRLHWKKGYEYSLLAVRALLDQNYDLNYEIIGGGPEEEKLRFTISDLNLTEHVRLLGQQPAEFIRQKLESADVFLLPSLSEGLSNAALEAMAMELPVVSTNTGGMAEAIRDNVDGFLVPSMNPLAMADRVKTLLDLAPLRKEMGESGRRRVEDQFSLSRQISCFIERYQWLLSH